MIDVTTTLAVSTLGRFEVRRNQEQLTGGNWNRRKVVDLFKLLLSIEQHRLHREQVHCLAKGALLTISSSNMTPSCSSQIV